MLKEAISIGKDDKKNNIKPQVHNTIKIICHHASHIVGFLHQRFVMDKK